MTKYLLALLALFSTTTGFAAGQPFTLDAAQSDAFAKEVVQLVGDIWTPAATDGSVLTVSNFSCSSGMTAICQISYFNKAGAVERKSLDFSVLHKPLAGKVTIHRGMGIVLQITDVVCHRVKRKTDCRGVDRLAR